jgi:hypothetical protein
MVREAGPAVSTGTGVFRKRKNQRCVCLGFDSRTNACGIN